VNDQNAGSEPLPAAISGGGVFDALGARSAAGKPAFGGDALTFGPFLDAFMPNTVPADFLADF